MTENTTASGAADTISGASEAILGQLEDALVEWSGYVTADDAPRTLREHASPHIKMLRAELGRLHAFAASAPVAPAPQPAPMPYPTDAQIDAVYEQTMGQHLRSQDAPAVRRFGRAMFLCAWNAATEAAPITDAEQAAWHAGIDEGRSQVRAPLQQGEYPEPQQDSDDDPASLGAYLAAWAGGVHSRTKNDTGAAEEWISVSVERLGHAAAALIAARGAAQAAPALPAGWVPLTITHEGDQPEEVAFGPQIMMDRLKKWLDRYFAMLAAPAVEQVGLVGVRPNGDHVNLGKVAMPPRMKARELATEQFGHFTDDDGSDAELCFYALEQFLAWLIGQGWGPAPVAEDADQPHGFIKPDTGTHVYFYEQDFYVLSNFSAFTLYWDDVENMRFDTSEAAYHWEKFPGHDDIRAAIINAPSAHEAFKVAERNKAHRRPDWDDVKVDVMRRILRAKVEQHEYVRRKLLATGDRILVEDSWRDNVWGWGPNRDGQNLLGKLWMEVRDELRAQAAQPEGGA